MSVFVLQSHRTSSMVDILSTVSAYRYTVTRYCTRHAKEFVCKNDGRKKMFGSLKLLKLFTSVFPLSIVVFLLYLVSIK